MKPLKEDEGKSYVTLLQHAIKEENFELAKFLIEKGANINGPHVFEMTPSTTETITHTKEQIESLEKEVEELKK